MNIRIIIRIVSFIILYISPSATLFAADIEGSKDHKLFKRYEGSEIIKYEFHEYDGLTIPLGKAKSSSELLKSVQAEGSVTRLTYKIPLGRSSLEVIRNYENELKALGFTPLFSGSKDELGSYFAEAAGYKELQWPPNIPALTLNSDTQRFLAVEKKGPEGSLILSLYAIENRFWASDLKNIEKGQVLLQVDIVESKPMDTKMVIFTSKEMAQEISASGSVSLYGIYFDTNKADIKPESSATLKQIASLMTENKKLRLLVVGHTDIVGTFAYNMELSTKRAASVVKELTTKYGVPADRLTPVGVSYACPVAPNKTEEGKAKNRRVALVEDSQ
ncbi:MAG: DUF4892 domain-containing protein [Desulfobacula sp.]|jgi:outer membrane protein OmpA-like peptidoglycan-associated protein